MLCFRDLIGRNENVSTDVCGSMIGSTVVHWTKRGWLIGCRRDWLIGWRCDWLIGWSCDWLIGWRCVGSLVGDGLIIGINRGS